MKTKLIISFLGLGLLLLTTLIMIGGCGERFYDEISYEYPNWTPEGLIYCQKAVTHEREYGGGYHENLGTDYHYVTMDIDGNNETILPYSSYPYFSPKGTYAALISGETISIYKRSDNSKVYEFSPTTEGIRQLDWGPEEDRLVYLKNKGDINIININGSNDFNIATSGESVSWKYGNKIVFEYLEGGATPLGVINYDGTDRINIWSESVSTPNISSISTNEVYGGHSTGYGYTDINLPTPKFFLKIGGFDGYLPRLSPTADKITYGAFRKNGIWLININGTNLKQLK